MIHELEGGITVDLTHDEYQDYLTAQFIKRYGNEITTDQLATWQRVTRQTIYGYRRRKNDPLKPNSGLSRYRVREAQEWFKRNKKGLYKK